MIANRVAGYLQKELNLSEDDKEVLSYSLTITITSILGYLLIMFVAWFLGVIKYAMISVIATSTLRVFSGGAHASASYKCIGFGGVIFPLLGYLTMLMPINLNSILLISFITFLLLFVIVYLFAPADTHEKPITTKQDITRLKRLSFGVGIIWAIIIVGAVLYGTKESYMMALAGNLGLLWQVFTLTPYGYRIIHMVDKVFP